MGQTYIFGRDRITPKTGVTTSQATGDDGDLEKGYRGTRFSAVSNNTFIDFAQNLEIIDNPAKIIPGGTGATTITFEGAWTVNTAYSVGDVIGIDEDINWSGSITLSNSYYWTMSAFEKAFTGFEDNSRQSHQHIYICNTSHTSQADAPAWQPNTFYAYGTLIIDNGTYWREGNNPSGHTSATTTFNDDLTGNNWLFVDLYTAKWELFQNDLAKWTETKFVNDASSSKMSGLDVSDWLTEINALDYNGKTDWRMANLKEIINLLDLEPSSDSKFLGTDTILTGYDFPDFKTRLHSSTPDYMYTDTPADNVMTISAGRWFTAGAPGFWSGDYGIWYGMRTATCPTIIVRDV